MEAILGLFLLFGGIAVVRVLLSTGARTAGAAIKTATGKGSFSENMDLAFKGMGPFEIRVQDIRLGEDGKGPLAKEIEGRGLFPIRKNTQIGFVTSVFDDTSGKYQPVISALENFQEPESVVYQHSIEAGQVLPNYGYPHWTKLGIVIPEILQPPHSGSRQMDILFRVVDLDNMPEIRHGFHGPDAAGLLWAQTYSFSYDFTEKGYEEAAADRDEAIAISVKIGIAIAMADGSLDDREGETLKNWIRRSIEPFSAEKQQRLKALYNKAMKEAYRDAVNGDLSLSSLTTRLNQIAEKTVKYETVELCFDVMAADGIADAEEIKTIRKVAEALDLNLEEIEKMRDQKIIGLDASVSDHASIEDLLGIEAHWDKEQIKKHLRAEFQKWNNRLNTLSEGGERDNAQRMLDLIAEARKNYA